MAASVRHRRATGKVGAGNAIALLEPRVARADRNNLPTEIRTKSDILDEQDGLMPTYFVLTRTNPGRQSSDGMCTLTNSALPIDTVLSAFMVPGSVGIIEGIVMYLNSNFH